jgi:hypothetical protein
VKPYSSRQNSIIKERNCKTLLECITEGCRSTSEIHRAATAKGLEIKEKNIFSYLQSLRCSGLIMPVSGKRPAQWVLTNNAAKEIVDPCRDFPPALALMMGYTATKPEKPVTVSPLTIFELAGYKKLSNNAIGTGKKPISIACSLTENI